MIILSFVRCNASRTLGFTKDKKRLNVSLTRARCLLVIVGCSKTLAGDETFKKLLDYIRTHGSIWPIY